MEKVVLETLRMSGLPILKKHKVSLSVAVVSEKEIKKINRIYRHQNEKTDVLTFSEFQSGRQIERAADAEKKSFWERYYYAIMISRNIAKKIIEASRKNWLKSSPIASFIF